jgi:hypothetical protein
MKSIQIILLLCIHIGDDFPKTMDKDAIQKNLNILIEQDLIMQDFSSNVIAGHSYKVTERGKTLICSLYNTFLDKVWDLK